MIPWSPMTILSPTVIWKTDKEETSSLQESIRGSVWSGRIHGCSSEHLGSFKTTYTMTFYDWFSYKPIVRRVLWLENYPRNLITFVFFLLSPWLTVRDLLVWFCPSSMMRVSIHLDLSTRSFIPLLHFLSLSFPTSSDSVPSLISSTPSLSGKWGVTVSVKD